MIPGKRPEPFMPAGYTFELGICGTHIGMVDNIK